MIQYFEIDQEVTKNFIAAPLKARQRAYHEIMWIQSGTADFIIDGDHFSVVANAFFILPKDRYHQFLPKKSITGQVLRFTEDLLDHFPRLLFSKFNHLSEVEIEGEMNEVFTLLFQLVKMEYPNNLENPIVIKHLLKTIIYKLDYLKTKQFPTLKNHSTSMDLFDRFQILLDEHIHQHRTVNFYAQLLNITPRKLGETVKSILNSTTENTISKCLLIEIKRELTYTDKGISEIAYELNFQDNSYFTKFFKKHTGMTPKKYRELAISAK